MDNAAQLPDFLTFSLKKGLGRSNVREYDVTVVLTQGISQDVSGGMSGFGLATKISLSQERSGGLSG